MSHIFVVDDSISVRKALELSLKREGLEVRTAASGEQALEKLGEGPVELIIADVIMPGISGFDLCRKLKADPKYAHVPLLIISGNVDGEVKQEAHDAGAIGVLKKPFRQEELMPAVQKALAYGSRASAEVKAATEPDEVAVPEPVMATTQIQDSPFAGMLERAVSASDTLAAAMISHQGETLDKRGEPLPPQIGMYARFFMGTATALGHQLKETGRPQVDIELGGKRLTMRGLGDNILVTLRNL